MCQACTAKKSKENGSPFLENWDFFLKMTFFSQIGGLSGKKSQFSRKGQIFFSLFFAVW